MTCVVAIADGLSVYMGGDAASADESGSFVSSRKEPKIFIRDDYILGFAGSFRFGKVVEHLFIPPKLF
jgi:hypothetical protein